MVAGAEFEEERVAVKDLVEGGIGDAERERFEVLYRVGREVLRAGSTGELSELAPTLAFETLRAERAALLLGAAEGEMTPRVSRHRDRGELAPNELAVPRPDHSVPGLEECEATILFADLRGFTATAERVPPAQLARLLNEYYALVTSIVFAHGGSVNEYVGRAYRLEK